jgi:hypothetical protein
LSAGGSIIAEHCVATTGDVRPQGIHEGGIVRRIILLASLVAPLLAAAPAVAGQPVMFEETLTASTPAFNFSCTPYGYSYDMLATFTVTRRYIRFYEGGALVREIRHVHFAGTLYRSDDRSKTIPYAGTWTITIDVSANTATNTGLFRYSHPDGSGMVTLNAGRMVQTATPPIITISDTAQLATEWREAVCAYVA